MWLYSGIVSIMLIVLGISITKEAKREPSGNLLKSKNDIFCKSRFIEIIFIIIMSIFWLLTAFRSYDVGNDTYTYVNNFNKIAKYGVDSSLHIEIGFQYFCLLISKINNDPHFFLLVNATICYLATTIYILKYSKNILFSLVLFFCLCFSDFTTMLRQNLSMIIILYAYQSLKDKKYIKFLIMVYLASVFHTSAWFALILLFYKVVPSTISVSLIISCICIIMSITGLISPLLSVVFSQYSSYFQGVFAGTGWLAVFYNMLRNGAFYIIMHWIYSKRVEAKLQIWPFFIALIVTCLAFTMNQFLRGGDYFIMLAIVELPNALATKRTKNENVIILFLGIILLSYFLITLKFRPEWNSIYPYKFYWNS